MDENALKIRLDCCLSPNSIISLASVRIAGHSEHHSIQRQRICTGRNVTGEQTSWQSVVLWSRLLPQDAVPSFISGQNTQFPPSSLSPEWQNKPKQPSSRSTSGPHRGKRTQKEVCQQHKGLCQHQRLTSQDPQTYWPQRQQPGSEDCQTEVHR